MRQELAKLPLSPTNVEDVLQQFTTQYVYIKRQNKSNLVATMFDGT